MDRNWADMGISAFDCYREYELSNITARSSMRGDNFLTDILPDLRIFANSRFCVAGLPDKRKVYEQCKHKDNILTVAFE